MFKEGENKTSTLVTYFTNLRSYLRINPFQIFSNYGKVPNHVAEIFDTTAVGPRANDQNPRTLGSVRFTEDIIQNLILCYDCVIIGEQYSSYKQKLCVGGSFSEEAHLPPAEAKI